MRPKIEQLECGIALLREEDPKTIEKCMERLEEINEDLFNKAKENIEGRLDISYLRLSVKKEDDQYAISSAILIEFANQGEKERTAIRSTLGQYSEIADYVISEANQEKTIV